MTKTIALAVALFGISTAGAQPKPQPKPPDKPAEAPAPAPASTKVDAKTLYEEGLKAYNLGEYDTAITKFKAAYAESSAIGLLFNIAQSYRLKKDYEQASNFYLTYLRLKPDAPNRADVEQRIEEMGKLQKEQDAMARRPPEGTVTPDGQSTTPRKDPTVTVNVVDGRAGRSDGSSGSSLKTAGLATAGAGAALVITGLVFGKLAKDAEKQLNQLSPDMGTWSQEQQDTYDGGKRNNTIAIISFVAGGAAVTTGAVLWVLGSFNKSETRVAVMPSAQGAHVAVGWSF